MRKVVVVLLLASVLVLAISVPALARTENPAKNFGQLRSGDIQYRILPSGIPPGSEISWLAHEIKADPDVEAGIYNVGDFVAYEKATYIIP
jgi:hypothetical protein